jgi:hypothetical protein
VVVLLERDHFELFWATQGVLKDAAKSVEERLDLDLEDVHSCFHLGAEQNWEPAEQNF